MSEFLEARGVCKSYLSGQEKLDVLVNLDLTLKQGQMIAVTGASGSGKSTFLHVVGGMDSADAGSVIIAGQDLAELGRAELARFRNRHIGFVFQFHHLLPEFSAVENVMFPLLLRRSLEKEARGRAEELLGEVGLGDRLTHRPGELSGGEQQRVAVARALAGGPSLLLADEPTGNLDAHSAETMFRLLTEVHARHNLTSIIVTHNPRLASLCEAEYRMVDGSLAPATERLTG
jgi:lipoprotein-releasing system ATP-binding protein